MSTPLTTEAELHAAFPKASYWWIKLQVALLRESSIEIRSRISRDDLDLAIQQKLMPGVPVWRFRIDPNGRKHYDVIDGWKPNQALKKAATLALDDAIKPRRTGAAPKGRIPCQTLAAVARNIVGRLASPEWMYSDGGLTERHMITEIIDHIDRLRVTHGRSPLSARLIVMLRTRLADLLDERRIGVWVALLKSACKHRGKPRRRRGEGNNFNVRS